MDRTGTNKHTEAKDGPIDTSPTSSPLPVLDGKVVTAFPTGKPREEDLLETVICKHCKRPTLKQTAAEHVRGCLKAKQEKARKKKEARDAANRAKAGDDKDDDPHDKDGDTSMMGQKSAKKSAVKGIDDNKKGKKRKADEDDGKEPKKKKKKDEIKPKTTKPKGPVDVEKQCGVTLPNGAQCARSLTCKSHSMGAKRSVPGRTLPYDMLLQQYQKKNQARQQSTHAAHPANLHCADNTDLFEPQRPLSMPMHLCRKTLRTQAPLTPTKRETLSWPLLPAQHLSLWFIIPLSPASRSIAMSVSKSRCRTRWESGAAVAFSPTMTVNPSSEACFSQLFPTTSSHPPWTPMANPTIWTAKGPLLQVPARIQSRQPNCGFAACPAHNDLRHSFLRLWVCT
jgi:hypothetical protein